MSDLIDRAQAQTELQFVAKRYTVAHEAHGEGHVVWSDNLISVADAMNALRNVPSAELGTNLAEVGMGCISRQAALEWCLEGLNNMPSAQPEHYTDALKAEIKRMKRSFTICINSDYYKGYMSALSAVEGYIAQMEVTE